jgi:arabinan endo-1,5-alpha-L-arabinosidase
LDETDTGKVMGADGYYFDDNEQLHTKIARGKWSDEADDLDMKEFSVIEAPYIHYRNGYYYLFVNWGGCCDGVNSTYNIRVGRSTNIKGPYRDKKGRKMLKRKGSKVLPANPSKVPRIHGPGHAGIFKYQNKDWFSFHFYDSKGDYDGGTLGVY